jgi:hypothetical protein
MTAGGRYITILGENGVKIGRVHWRCGEVVLVPEDDAARYIALGWAEDTRTGESNPRKRGAVTLTPDDMVQEVVG